MNKTSAFVLLAIGLLAQSSLAAESGLCDSSADNSRALVLGFYEQALLKKQPKIAFARFMSSSFVEHKQDVPEGTRDAVVAFLEGLMRELPLAQWEVLRTIAEPELVFLHARFTPAPGAPPYVIADIFRVENCKIVEHWDVVAPPRAPQRSTSSGKHADT